MRRHITRWGPVISWMALIFFLSAQPALPQLVPAAFQGVATTTAHVSEYAVLAALLFRAGAPFPQIPGLGGFLILWTVGWLYGISDEFHQSFIPARTATVEDVAADASGAALALFACYLWRKRRIAQKRGTFETSPASHPNNV